MDLEIVTIGDELLLGFTVDTNAAYIARALSSLGVRIVQRTTCGDLPESIAAAVSEALERTGAVITTGGLGPTADDRTKPAIAAIFGSAMILDESILKALERRWLERFGRELPTSNRQQAMVPEHATILENRHGSAPGIWLENSDGKWVAMLPGVPREMRGMLADTIVPRIRESAGSNSRVIRSRTVRTCNISESALADRLGDYAGGMMGLSLAFLPGSDGVDLRLTANGMLPDEADALLGDASKLLSERAGRCVYGFDDDDLAALVLTACADTRQTIAVAESCTGGLLGARLTSVPGSSRVFQGGILAYSNDVKMRELGVSAEVLAQHGAVSRQVAVQMAQSTRTRFKATIGIGITGIAGPDGGSREKPVGTVWIGLDIGGDVSAVLATLPGNRNEIRHRAAQLALDRVRRALEDVLLPPPTRAGADSAGWETQA